MKFARLGVLPAVGAMVLVILLPLPVATAQSGGSPAIVPIENSSSLTIRGQYPADMVVPNQHGFDGSYLTHTSYQSHSGKFVVALWESGPGILHTNGYPHDEYCLVVSGDLVITNQSGSQRQFHPGDTFVIPKGWVGRWNMKTRFKKQFVALEENAGR